MGNNKRRYVTPEQVRQNAIDSGGGNNWFNLPEGVRQWTPEKAGTYPLSILPYEVVSRYHPDKIEPGLLWYKNVFTVHHGVGVNQESIICPRCVNKPCFIHQEQDKLRAANGDGDIIKSLGGQRYVAFNILDPDDEEKVAIFIMSWGKFMKPLEKELEQCSVDLLGFYHVDENGKIIKVRFSEESFSGRKYLQASRFDFEERPEMDEEEVLQKVVCLDTAFKVLPYDQIKSLFLQIEEVKAPAKTTAESSSSPAKEKEQTKEEKPTPKKEEKKQEETPAEKKPETKKEEVEKPKMLKVGDDVTWDDGDSSGQIVKIHSTGTKYKVKNADDEEVWIAIEEVSLKVTKKETPAKKEEKKDEEEPSAKKSTGEQTCPVKNGIFGKNVDKFDECDECPIWDACEAANTAGDKK